MPEFQGNSYKVWCSPPSNQTVWPFEFVGGYINKDFVKMRYLNESGVWIDVALTHTDFTEDNTLTVQIPPAQIVEVYRDTEKRHPIVSYGFGGSEFMLESQSAAARQPIHIVDELVDRPARESLQEFCAL